MNLLNLLLKSLLTDSSLSALAKKTGLNAASLKKLIPLAVPLLIKFLTNNASSQSGALSLLGALGQHTSTKSMDLQIDEADTDDGDKIIHHIFGDQSDAAVESLAEQSGMTTRDVSSALSGIAPALLSGLSAATSSASLKPAASGSIDLSDGLDLSELMMLFGGQSSTGLFGGKPQSSGQGGGLLSGLLGGGFGGGLLGSLLGGGSPAVAEEDSSLNGNQLLSLLTALR
ncbi:MAG: DUF937 domain-containing protein [Oscillospiraceae bacterium]|nr:DUF937 domain-containing protein [Oscillospiraceae bacterium]